MIESPKNHERHQVTSVSRHLATSSLAVTSDVYGRWESAERKREALAMEGVFGV
jgi:hypothetical protein